MREVIPNCDTCNCAPQLPAAPDTPEARDRLDCPRRIDAGSLRRGDSRERIVEVVLALKLQAQQSNRSASVEYFKSAPPQHACVPPIFHAKPFHCAPAAASKDTVGRRVSAIYYQFSGSGYRSDEIDRKSTRLNSSHT